LFTYIARKERKEEERGEGRYLIDVLDPTMVVLDGVDGDSNDLDVAFGELGLNAG
jgi:hypothetical protein